MNTVNLLGRLTKDIEVRYGDNSETAVAHFSIAVNRRFKNKDGNYDADFINCVAFGKTAEFLEKWFKKGQEIAVTGRIQTGSYTNKDGNKVYTTDVVVENVFFAGKGSKNDESEFKPVDDNMDELPFD